MPTIEETQPTQRKGLDEFQPIPIQRLGPGNRDFRRKHSQRIFWLGILAVFLVYFFAPFRTNILILGTDDSPTRGDVGRTDTMILSTFIPLKPYIGLLGIPRDLWLPIPNVGEQRINTAYFFAEALERGTGAAAAREAVSQNFGVTVDYHFLLHMQGVVDVVDALGGVDINLSEPLAGLPAGSHHLDGIQALAFIRDRYTGDDFGRMKQGQVMVLAILKKMINPLNIPRLPATFAALSQTIDTNIPGWQSPRLIFALLRGMIVGFDTRIIDREMVTPFQTDQGAQVLAPRWENINPVLMEMFGE